MIIFRFLLKKSLPPAPPAFLQLKLFLVPCGKFSGPNDVQAEHLRFGGPTLLSWLTTVFNSILATGIVPAFFAYDHVVPLLKSSDNDPSVPSNYRGITLTSVISKILSICFFHVFSLIFS